MDIHVDFLQTTIALVVPFVTFPLDFAMNAKLFEIIGKKTVLCFEKLDG